MKLKPDSRKLKLNGKARRSVSKMKGEHLLVVYECAPIGIVECSPEGMHLNVNNEFCRITNYEKEDLLTHSIQDISYEDDYLNEIKLYEQLIAGKILSYKIEKRYIRKDSDIIWVQVNRSSIRDSNDRTLYTVGIVQDITERRQAEALIRFQSHLLENVHDAVIATNDKLQISSWNHGAEELYGWTAAEVLGRPIIEVTQTELTHDERNLLVDRVVRENSVIVEAVHHHKNGHAIQVEARGIPLYGDDGRVTGYVTAVLDITQRKQAEEALRESEERIRRAFEIETVGIIFFDLNGMIINANQAFLQMSGYSPADVEQGQVRWDKMTPEEFMPASYSARDELRTKGATTPYEKQYIRKDGSRWWGLFAARLLGENEGVEFILDITDSKQAEDALREAKERYRNLFDWVPVPIYACDANGLILEFNQSAVELWGRVPEKNNPEERYCGSFKIYYPDGRPMPHNECPMARVLNGETFQPHELEILVERPDGVRRNVLAHPWPVKNEYGEIVQAINCLYDITQRKQAEQALHQLNLQLEGRVQDRTEE